MIWRYRAKQKTRDINASQLKYIPPDSAGYMKILDFYRHSDAALYRFNRQKTGPQHFADMKRNVAILDVREVESGAVVFNAFAVSGDNAPGLQASASEMSLFVASEVADGAGLTYLRNHDAEFKLCAVFCSRLLGRPRRFGLPIGSGLRGVLFSYRPPCKSCSSVLYEQLPRLAPGLEFEVRVGQAGEADECVARAGPLSRIQAFIGSAWPER